ncbi:hypothetical protein AK812_SmicGene18589 [Symbiodinium microadriaticum]|uniref:Uncharacterized protein n=1 Tax=Symbiodinium microadriaticum TaxID=2951 RepID=A0A1Q9DUR3_SYMMI|nr:hypothetical protein AK812_SmicGene18589 [Symbiodinium microadriaticum]
MRVTGRAGRVGDWMWSSLIHHPTDLALNAAVAAGQRGHAWRICLELVRGSTTRPDTVALNAAASALASGSRWREGLLMATEVDETTVMTLGASVRAGSPVRGVHLVASTTLCRSLVLGFNAVTNVVVTQKNPPLEASNRKAKVSQGYFELLDPHQHREIGANTSVF